MENLENHAVSAGNSANNVHLELTAQEVKLSTDCLGRLAQALIQVHNLAEQLVIAEEIVAQCATEYGITVEQRIRFKTPIDGNTIYSDRANIERAIAASKVWEARAALDKNLAHHAGREGRDLLLTIRNFQAENLQTPEFQLQNSLKCKEKESEPEPTATTKPREAFHRLKNASIASIRRCISNISATNNDAAERKSMHPSSMFRTSLPDLAAIAKATKAIEDAAVSTAIGGLTERIFLPMKAIVLQGNVARNVSICKQNQCALVEQLEDHAGIVGDSATICSGLESQNGPLAEAFETGNHAYHGAIIEAISEATLRRQNSMSAVSTNAVDGSSDSYSLGGYYDSDSSERIQSISKNGSGP